LLDGDFTDLTRCSRMRANNEVSVDRLELKRAASWTRRGRQAERDRTLLYFAEDGFTVETPRAITKIKSVGRWIIPIAVHAMPLKRLTAKLPATKEITLLYFDGWLSVGSVKLSAMPIKDEPLDGGG
jgi:hypothetical protein